VSTLCGSGPSRLGTAEPLSAGNARSCGWSTEQSRSVFFEHDFVDVAPIPAFAGFQGLDDGVFAGVEVFGGMLVFRGVAAADVAAGEAEAEVHPAVTHLEALFAAFGFRLGGLDVFDVGTGFSGHQSLSLEIARALDAANGEAVSEKRLLVGKVRVEVDGGF
jgi:hypothetical protein